MESEQRFSQEERFIDLYNRTKKTKDKLALVGLASILLDYPWFLRYAPARQYRPVYTLVGAAIMAGVRVRQKMSQIRRG